MNLPDLSKMEIPKRLSGMIFSVYLIKDIENIYMAALCTAIIVAYVLGQTYTDVKGKTEKAP